MVGRLCVKEKVLDLKLCLAGLQSPHLQDQRIHHQLRHIVYVFFLKIRNPLPNVFVYAEVLAYQFDDAHRESLLERKKKISRQHEILLYIKTLEY